MHRIVLFGVLILIQLDTAVSQNSETFDPSAIFFTVKLFLLDEELLPKPSLSAYFEDEDDIFRYLVYLNSLNYRVLESKGFDRYNIVFVEANNDTPGNFIMVPEVPYIVAIFVDEKGMIPYAGYRLSGFEENDFKLFLEKLYSKNTNSNYKMEQYRFLVYDNFYVENLDFACLFEALKDKKNKNFHECLISNRLFDAYKYSRYHFRDGPNPALEWKIIQMKSMGRFADL